LALNIYYDGDCYFCSNFVRKLELEKVYGQINLFSIRDDLAVKEKIQSLGFNVNKGFLIEYNQKWYWGDEAYKLVNINKKFDVMGLISRIPYRFLVLGRYVTLIFQGIGLIDITQKDNENSIFVRSIRLCLLSVSFILLSLSFLFITSSFINDIKLPFSFSKSSGFLCTLMALLFLYLTYLIYNKVKIAEKIKSYFVSQSYYFWFGYIFLITFILNFIPIISLNRIILFFLMLPLVVYFYVRYKSEKNNKNGKSGIVLSGLILFCIFPGLYIAPFFNGIAGWFIEVDTTKNFKVSAYVLTNSDDEKVTLNHALLQPSSQIGRLEKAWRHSKRSKSDFMIFSFNNYKRLYPIIRSGSLSHQKVLGQFAYPTHNLSHSNASAYKNFPPEDIESISQIIYIMDWSGTVVSKKEINIVQIQKE
jgi:hypothetical protein